MLNILCFGDSITLGEKDLNQGGWVDRLKVDYLNQFSNSERQEVKVYNLGIGGETTDGLVKRFETEFNARAINGQDSIVILSYGINDIVIHKEKNIVPEKYFLRNLRHAINYAKTRKAKILLVSLLPISDLIEGKVNQHRKLRFDRDIRLFNLTLKQLAEESGSWYLDSYKSFIEGNKQLLLSIDGIHPNSKGHLLLYRIIQKKLQEILP